MTRGLVRGAAYLPRFTDGHRRVGGYDEDPFTFAAAALERARGAESWIGRPVTITVVGAAELPEPSALGNVLGATVAPPKGTGGERSLADALHGAAGGPDGPEWLVVIAADGGGAHPSSAGPPGEGAAALLLDDRSEAVALAPLLAAVPSPPKGGELSWLFALVRAHHPLASWTGDWLADPTAGEPFVAGRGRQPAPAAAVSQGAFVPPARDAENRASRWRLVADRCDACGARTFPSRGRCRGCGSVERLRAEPLPQAGATVTAVTWIGSGGQPTEFDGQVEACGPYGVVLAEVAPDVRLTLSVAEGRPEQLRVGARVDTVLRRLYPIEGVWRYGRKAVPAVAPSERGDRRGPSS